MSDKEISAKYLGTRSPSVECFFVQVDGRVVGFVQYHVADDGGEGGDMDLVLRESERGVGIGTAVVRAVVEFVQKQLGWKHFTVDPTVSNIRGFRFWNKVGVVPVRIVPNEAGGEPHWLMEWPRA